MVAQNQSNDWGSLFLKGGRQIGAVAVTLYGLSLLAAFRGTRPIAISIVIIATIVVIGGGGSQVNAWLQALFGKAKG